MTLIDRLAKRFGFVRQKRAEAPSSNFHMAAVNRLTASWTTTSASADSQARQGLVISRARARQLRDENDYAAKFVSMVKTNVLGEKGIMFRSGVRDPDRVQGGKLIPGGHDVFANKTIEDNWWKWGHRKYCTLNKQLSWCEIQRVALEAVAVDGETIIRKVPQLPTDNPFGFTLKLYEASRLDVEHNEMVTENGNQIRMGVEMDNDGRRVAYHLLTNDPSETYFFRQDKVFRERVPADQIIHLGITRRADQTRCIPWMITSGYRMNMVGKYEEAEVTAARVAASKMGFITKTSPAGEYTGDKDTEGNKIMDAEPGCFEELEAGQDIKTVDWQHPSTAYAAFLKTALRGVAAGLNVSYNSLANDMESVNFASGKLGLMEEREVWKAIQAWFIEAFCEEVFEAWLKNSILAGAINLPYSKLEKFNSPIFRGRRWQYVNPSQDVDADIRQLNSGLTSISRLLAERNIDRDELFDEIDSDREALEARGIQLPELQSKIEIAEATAKSSASNQQVDEEDDSDPTP
jgi:lambda family phage portal protein